MSTRILRNDWSREQAMVLFRRSLKLIAKYLRKLASSMDTLSEQKSGSIEDMRTRARHFTYRLDWFMRAMERSGVMDSYDLDRVDWNRADYLPHEELFYLNNFYAGARVVLRNRISPEVAVIDCPDKDKLSIWDGYGIVDDVQDHDHYDVSIIIKPDQWPKELWLLKGYAMMWLDENKVVTAHEKAQRMMKRRKLI